MPRATHVLTALGAVAAAGLGYSLVEAHRYTLRREEVRVLPYGSRPLRVLHLSDLHLTPAHTGRVAWVRSLAALDPDLVVVTGDFLGHREAVPTVIDALGPLLERPGLFVLGSNDYYEPSWVKPWRYLMAPSDLDEQRALLPWGDLVKALTAEGWTDLDNARATLDVAGLRVDVRGTDDPHIRRDDYGLVSGPYDADADLRLGVTHAPYRRVIDAMEADGADLVIAGHTHGGQLCVPFWGALVTNCDLPTAQAKGLSRVGGADLAGHPGRGGADGKGAFLHVSAGLGTSPYAPVRFACPPEATLLTLAVV